MLVSLFRLLPFEFRVSPPSPPPHHFSEGFRASPASDDLGLTVSLAEASFSSELFYPAQAGAHL